MIDPYLLTEIVTFKETGTLAKTAEQLNVTQPTVTRGMQKLEDELNVQLFERQPNRITLTTTGEFAAVEAAKLLKQNQEFVEKTRNFNRQQAQIIVSSTVPGPLLMLKYLQKQLNSSVIINHNLQNFNNIPKLLGKRDFSLIFSNEIIESSDIESILIGNEELSVNLDQFMRQANQSSITFAELANLSFLVLEDIGAWREIIQSEIPNARFLYQAEHESLQELTNYSSFPYFSSNLSFLENKGEQLTQNDDRVNIPISDSRAQMPIYAYFLTQNKQKMLPIIEILKNNWLLK